MDARYSYWLLSNDSGQSLHLTQAPQGWDATKLNFVRDLTYIGIVKTLSVEFAFVGDGFKFIQKHRLRYGWDANIKFICYKVKGNVFQYEGKVNMENGSEARKPGTFKVDIVQSAAVQKFNNSQDVELNILNDLSIDRTPVTPAYLQPATVRGKSIQFYTEFKDSLFGPDTPDRYHHSWPLKTVINGNPGAQSGYNIDIGSSTAPGFVFVAAKPMPIDLRSPDSAFYINTIPQDQVINVHFEVEFTETYIGGGEDGNPGPPWVQHAPDPAEGVRWYPGRRLVIRLVSDSTTTDADDIILFISETDMAYGFFSYSGDLTITVPNGWYVVADFEKTVRTTGDLTLPPGTLQNSDLMQDPGVDGIGVASEVVYSKLFLTITQPSVVDDSEAPIILPHELFSNLIAQICGCSINAPVFGRVDLGYAVDGEWAYLATTLGAWIRGIDPDKAQYSASFKQAFLSYSSVICLGVQIVDNVVYIDVLDALFNFNIATTLPQVNDFKVEPLKEFMFNSVKAGYPLNEYEQENGRDEPNTQIQYSNSFQSVKKELNLISIFCGDSYGVEFARRAGIIKTGTQDSRYDNKIFFLDLIKNEDGSLMTRRLEDILLLEGVFSPETMINARLAIPQNMLRWRKFMNIPLDKKPNKVLFFQSKDKNVGLHIITILGETRDGEDVQLGTQYLFLPDAHLFDCPVTQDNINGILANPNGVIEYSYGKETFFDFIMGVDVETDKRATKWRMIGTKSTPPDEETDTTYGPFIKYDDGLTDFVKHNDGSTDFIKYAD